MADQIIRNVELDNKEYKSKNNPAGHHPKYNANKNEANDRSAIRKGDGTVIMKHTCDKCGFRYGYNVLDGDPGCRACAAGQTIRDNRKLELKRLEEQVLEAEREELEFKEKEMALKKRLEKAKKKTS